MDYLKDTINAFQHYIAELEANETVAPHNEKMWHILRQLRKHHAAIRDAATRVDCQENGW